MRRKWAPFAGYAERLLSQKATAAPELRWLRAGTRFDRAGPQTARMGAR